MLQTIRERAQGWIAWAIVILISIPFALWGIQSYLGVGGEPIAATVNGIELSVRDLDRRVEQARLELRQRLGAAYDPSQIDDRRLRSEVLDEMVQETLLLDEVRQLGLRASDQAVQMQILSDPAFQVEGRFSKETYERLLQYQGLSPAMYEAQLRQQMAAGQLVQAVASSELITNRELGEYQRLMGQKREVAYMTLPLADYASDAPVDETSIAEYYKEHASELESPEQVKLDYILLDIDSLASTIEVGEDDLRQAYEADDARFAQPERRNVRHILRKVGEDADEATAQKALQEIEALRERVLAGEPFEELAKQESEDPGSAANGGSLGVIEAGIMVPAFDQAAFSLEQGTLSLPVRTRFGYHLIQVTEIMPPSVKPFEEVRDQLKAEVSKQRAEGLYYDLGERLATITYESPDSLEPAAEELGLEVQHTDWLGRSGGEGILAQPKVMSAAFSDEVRVEGRNSDLIEPEADQLQAVVIRAADHREASVKPLDEVRDEIVDTIREAEARKAALASAEALAVKVRTAGAWPSPEGGAAEDASKPKELGLVERRAPQEPAAVLEAAFKLPVPGADGASVGTAVLDDGSAAVVRVTKIEDGQAKAAEDGTPAPEAMILAQVLGREASEDMLRDMEDRADIERKPVAQNQEP